MLHPYFSGCVHNKDLSPKHQQQWQYMSGYITVTVVSSPHHFKRFEAYFEINTVIQGGTQKKVASTKVAYQMQFFLKLHKNLVLQS